MTPHGRGWDSGVRDSRRMPQIGRSAALGIAAAVLLLRAVMRA